MDMNPKSHPFVLSAVGSSELKWEFKGQVCRAGGMPGDETNWNPGCSCKSDYPLLAGTPIDEFTSKFRV